jgi:NAD(P)H-hydrate repair Nnr-like enzyme with NAD(P)H-hydrate dehydratase domain
VDPADIEARRLEHARRAAAELGATVLLKGSTTVIASPGGGPVWANLTGTSWLATAGTGDVLSGLAGALIAQGLPVGQAAAAAAYLHGLAARLAAAGAGQRPGPAVPSQVIRTARPGAEAPIAAADVIGALPDAIRSVREQAA